MATIGHSRSGSARYSGLLANRTIRDVAFAPWAMITEPGAVFHWSAGHIPAAKNPVDGSRASTLQPAGRPVSQVGGSTIAVSRAGMAPVITLLAPPVLSQYTMPLRPFPAALSPVRPGAWPASASNVAPPSWPPM